MISRLEKLFKNENNYFLLAVVIMLVMTTAMMFFYSPLCAGGDFYVHYNRLLVLMEALANGSYPIYMDYHIMDGYGYLIKAFYCDILLIPFAIIGNLTSAIVAYQVMIFTLTFLCGIFTYVAAKKVMKCKYAAVITALLYTFATYRIFDIYIRGALGEVMSFTLLPILLLGAYEIIKGDYKKWYILTIGFTLLIFSHVISTILSLVILSIFLIVYNKKLRAEPKRFYYLLLAGVVCIPLTIAYILPMIEQILSNSFYYDTHQITTGVTGYRFNEVIAGLFNGVSLRNEQLFPKLGSLLTFVVLLRIFVSDKSKERKFADVCAIIGIILLLMTTPIVPWAVFPFSLLSVIQFPWRLLEYTTLLFALAGGYYISRLLLQKEKQKIIATVALMFIHILIFNSDSIHYKTFICNTNKVINGYEHSFRAMIGGEYLPSLLPSNNQTYDIPDVYNDFIHHRGVIVRAEQKNTKTSDLKKDKDHITFDVSLENKDNLELPLIYYKGYEAKLNNETIEYQQSEFGLIELPLNKSGSVEIRYKGTTIQKISYYINIISILTFCIFIIIKKKKKKI